MTEPQVWALIALFAGMLATVSGLVVRVVRSEIGGLRAEMSARFETVDARMDARFDAVDSRLRHLDRDVSALTRRIFGADQG